MSSDIGRQPEGYCGSRFFKCDLQMQTPFDAAHWVGEKFATGEEAAHAYIRRCYQVGLEVIAITEHNFASKQYIPLLKAKARELAVEFGYELVIFPGFEFTANVGRGIHVLAVFDPDMDLDRVDHLLTECGVPHPRQTSAGQHRPSRKSLDEILAVVQAQNDRGGKNGLVILPHIQSDSGMFDNARTADWLQMQEYKNPELLAVEVPKSPSRMSSAFRSLFGNGDDCIPDWKRTRSICCVMSSDAKTLVENDKTANAIGSKYTWIKMSTPSIEALRQAFLDHESRVRRSDEHPERPELSHTHPSLESVKISGAKFLGDKQIHFSRNLTTLIGGRGTGKSTLVEYLRLALQQEAELEADPKSQLYADFQNVRDTLSLPGSLVEVVYDKGPDFKNRKVVVSVETGRSGLNDPDIGDINTYLPVKIYSRGQIEAIANDPRKQATIIDDLILPQLEGLRNDERDLVRRLKDLNESLRQESDIKTSRAKLVADVSNLEARIEAIKGKHSSLDRWSQWNVEKQYLSAMESSASKHLDNLATTISGGHFTYKSPDTGGENAAFLERHRHSVIDVLSRLRATVEQAVATAKEELCALAGSGARTSWQAGFVEIDAENKAAIAELAELGIRLDEYDDLFRRLETARNQLAGLDKRLAEIGDNRKLFDSLYRDVLLEVWQKQYELRRDMADRLNDQVTKTKVGSPTVDSEVTKHGDFRSFCEIMAPHQRDRRVVSQADWETILRAAFDQALREDVSPLDIIQKWIASSRTSTPTLFPSGEVQPKKLAAVGEWLNEYDFNDLRTQRIGDAVNVSLNRREDGKKVGDLAGGKLSAGQKATTVLTLLLAEGTCPIIIDQPEDDLDNEFVFEQLVPMLRASKEKRQIIIVTHNANVPVNGDAELIVPLEVRDSRGSQKIVDGELAVGALDRHPVQRAVELILEGSSEAFRRRREKYGV